MQFSFLGYSVKKIMELELDVKDVTILRFFDDFRQSGRMNYEIIDGVKYYWISYQNIENELPFLGLGKRSIMMRMLKLRDLGVLAHYTKKEGGTFSYYALGERYSELIYIKDSNNDSNSRGGKVTSVINGVYNNNSREGQVNSSFTNNCNFTCGQTPGYFNCNNSNTSGQVHYKDSSNCSLGKEATSKNNEEDIQNNTQGRDYLKDFEEDNHKKEERMYSNNHKGYAEKCSTNTHLLNNSSTILTNIYNNIKEKVSSIINYLNSKVGVMYKASNTKTINLVKSRLKDGFTIEDFKTVIDKKVKAWKGTIFEQYLTPFTLFGEKFEVYLNQNIVKEEYNNGYINTKSYVTNKKLKFDNFKGRDYNFDKLEKQLLGWE
ncbi:conserved phage C-terminal domain-containing protein [Clostridium sp.]|uniref:conserved phage C-terminal domain-containing protein n=1 Tax=Clostridium sp. TaxID=1506 RepID=UPI002909F484|nr:conserved phage C-terminal domain-containing protein [Clostridium sp.]MDU5106945.1 conserved phage C-terminal domain-containing protein [Clostridium sp.]